MKIVASQNPEEAFTKAYEEYKDAIFRHCYFMTHKRELALEVTQDAFMKTWEYIAEGNDIDNIRAFLYRVAKNLVYNDARKKHETSLDELQEEGFDPGIEDPEMARDSIAEDTAVACLAKIKEPYKTAVVLRYVEGMSPKEIADITGDTPNTVSVRLGRGLEQLRSLMKQHG